MSKEWIAQDSPRLIEKTIPYMTANRRIFLNIIATYNLIYNATFMVEQGMGYGLCLENLVNTEGKRNLTFRPMEPELSVNACLVVKKYQVLSRSAQLLLDEILRRACKQ